MIMRRYNLDCSTYLIYCREKTLVFQLQEWYLISRFVWLSILILVWLIYLLGFNWTNLIYGRSLVWFLLFFWKIIASELSNDRRVENLRRLVGRLSIRQEGDCSLNCQYVMRRDRLLPNCLLYDFLLTFCFSLSILLYCSHLDLRSTKYNYEL
jgi:hypothetical protein